jgi:hypothetical protein
MDSNAIAIIANTGKGFKELFEVRKIAKKGEKAHFS